MIPPIVSAEGMTKAFAPKAGVFEIDLEIPAGAIVGFIGPSGSGKTTTVRLLTGLLAPDEGAVRVLGQTPSKFTSDTRGRIGYMPQHSILYPDLTLDQNLRFAASLYGLGSGAEAQRDELVEYLEIGDAMGRLPTEASGGEQRRLMLAATLLHGPDLLFLDEPTAGIDPVLRRRIWDKLSDVSASGSSLILTTQYVGEAAFCDFVAVLAEGSLLLFDTPEGLRRAAYGGELVDVVFREPIDPSEVDSLNRAIDASTLERIDGRTLRLVVDDAGKAGPAIAGWAGDTGTELVESEAHVPSFDDVFVELIQRLTTDSTSEDTADHQGRRDGV